MQNNACLPQTEADQLDSIQDSGGDNNVALDALDLTNIATLEEIKHLLVLAESMANPASLDLRDELQTWKEAQACIDAD